MANCATGSVVIPPPTIPSDRYHAFLEVMGSSWGGFGAGANYFTQYGLVNVNDYEQYDGYSPDVSGSWTSVVGDLDADRTHKVRAKASEPATGTYYGSTKTKKTGALLATAGTPSSSGVTSSAATIACDYYPNTYESLATVFLEYKKTSDSTWTQAGASDGSQSGYTLHNISRALSGLSPSTQYQFRLQLTRTTGNDTTLTSAEGSFTTLAGLPVVTTNAASNVANTSARLNGTLDINEATGCNVFFKWGTDNPPTQHQTANQPASADGPFHQDISGLPQNTVHYFQAFTTFSYPAGSPINGSVVSFQTTLDPATLAVKEARMQVYEFTRRYGVLLAAGAAPLENGPLVFTLQTPSATNSDTFVVGTSFAAGDVTISKDGGAPASTTNLPATLGNGYSLVLTAAEMQANEIDVFIKDLNGPAFRDAHLRVITHRQLGSMVLDCATGQKANATAFKAAGYGSGHGISAVKGATGADIDGVLMGHVIRHNLIGTGAANPVLDAGASAVNDFYNNMLLLIIAGTGSGQARIIKDYDGATLTVTPNRAWSTNPGTGAEYIILPGEDVWNVTPGAELTAIPTLNSSFGAFLQLLFQRFAYKITQTATVQTLYKSVAGGQTALGTRTVSDDGTTQTIGELSS